MTKEKFLYELIDNWLYLISHNCILMENYTQKDRTHIYVNCCDKLKKCLDFYDDLYQKLDKDKYTQEQVDEELECLIQQLKQETVKKIDQEIKQELGKYISDIDSFMNQYLYYDSHNNYQEISKKTLQDFIFQLREKEAEDKLKKMGS